MIINKTKQKLIYLAKIFEKYTDEDKGLSTNDILKKLSSEGIKVSRQTLYSDIETLKDCGMDILIRHGTNNVNEYFLASRTFEVPEIKMLIDAVQSSYFITKKKSSQLTEKIASLVSENQAKKIKREAIIADKIKASNETIYYTIDTIYDAINNNNKIRFRYFRKTPDLKKEYRNNGDYYIVSPYMLSWSNNNYYLICYNEKYNDMSQFRIDKIENICIYNEKRRKLDEDFNIYEYIDKMYLMYNGEMKPVTMRFHNSLTDAVIDHFGENISIIRENNDYFKITQRVSVSPTFYSWLFQFGDKAKILAPSDVLQELIKHTEIFLMSLKNGC